MKKSRQRSKRPSKRISPDSQNPILMTPVPKKKSRNKRRPTKQADRDLENLGTIIKIQRPLNPGNQNQNSNYDKRTPEKATPYTKERKMPSSPSFLTFCKTLPPLRHMDDCSPMQKPYNSENIFTKRNYDDKEFNPLSSGKKIAQKIDFMRYDDMNQNSGERDFYSPYSGGTQNFIVDPKLQNLDTSLINLDQDLLCREDLQYPATQPQQRRMVLVKSNHLLLSPNNPQRQIIFDGNLTEPPRQRKQPTKTFMLQKINSFHYNSEQKVLKCVKDLDDLFQNGGGHSSKGAKLKSDKKTKLVCNCKSSKCLKQYCVCFKAGQVCSKECNCFDCHNNESFPEQRNKAITQALDQNANCFDKKVDQQRHLKGCSCKKQQCDKKYCECFKAGVKCTDLCNCNDCLNMDPRFLQKQKVQNIFLQIPYQEHQHQHNHRHMHYNYQPQQQQNSYSQGFQEQTFGKNRLEAIKKEGRQPFQPVYLQKQVKQDVKKHDMRIQIVNSPGSTFKLKQVQQPPCPIGYDNDQNEPPPQPIHSHKHLLFRSEQEYTPNFSIDKDDNMPNISIDQMLLAKERFLHQ